MHKSRVYAGVSGYAYPEWLGGFYPDKLPAGRFFEHYASRLPAVEINHTFHRIPGEKVVRHWIEASPKDFRLCLKVQRSITHSGAAFPKAEAAASFSRAVAPASERLGPLLLDLPKAFRPDPDRLDEILAALERPAAVQFRDQAWFTSATWRVLERRRCSAAVVDDEGVPKAPRLQTAGFAYFRLRRQDLLLEELEAARAEGDVYAFVRHEPRAPERALELLARLQPAGGAGRETA